MAAASSPFLVGPSPSLSSPPAVASSSLIPFSVFWASGRCPRGDAGNRRRPYLCASFSARLVPCEEGTKEGRSSGGTEKKTQKSPSDYEQASRWSVRIPSQRTRFPWQEKKTELVEEQPQKPSGSIRAPTLVAGNEQAPAAARPIPHRQMSRVSNASPRRSNSRETLSPTRGNAYRRDTKGLENDSLVTEVSIRRGRDPGRGGSAALNDYPDFLSLLSDEISGDSVPRASSFHVDDEETGRDSCPSAGDAEKSMISSILETLITSRNNDHSDSDGEDGSVSATPSKSRTERDDGKKLRWKSNTPQAEKTIPEPELRRLRNLALKTKERTKVGPSGVTEALVEMIKRKWKEVEVVKLKFEGPPALHMKKTRDTLEERTGGAVIWTSGSSLVLYRGISYGLPCIQTYTKPDDPAKKITGSTTSDGIDSILDELGPRFVDWSGRDPQPVDADLLPAVVPGYTPPFRLLPYKTKLGLKNGEMTYLRRLARSMPPHFALGRNRMLQGLSRSIVKLWEKSVIAKIAIKRGVPDTCNERMAEEIKRLTGGVLLSRNKEFIVVYRGKDFLVPTITEVMRERQSLANDRQDEEERARLRASAFISLNTEASKLPQVAGTLAETLAAKSRWDYQLGSEEREKVAWELTLERHASSVRFLEKKLNTARGKVNKAEKALSKVQEFLSPAELPTDLETVTDEERSLYRKIGLKMKSFLSLGRREVFDGTVENMHLNWKHRELVKIIVRGKSFPQVKHIAISLEAESGGILISVDKTTKGYAIIVYRGKNYSRPKVLRPKNLLTRRQALARSIELQRREALNFHISNLRERIEVMKSDLERRKVNGPGHTDGHHNLNRLYPSDDDVEDEGEEAYLRTYDSSNDDVDE